MSAARKRVALSPERRRAEAEEAEKYARDIVLEREGRLAMDEFSIINARIIRQYSLTALSRIKERAWAIVEGRAK
jgi:hypothetical protein